MWTLLEPALFGLLGASIDVKAIDPAILGASLIGSLSPAVLVLPAHLCPLHTTTAGGALLVVAVSLTVTHLMTQSAV